MSSLQNKLLVTVFLLWHVLPDFGESYLKRASELIEEAINFDEFLNSTLAKVKVVMSGENEAFDELFKKVKPHAEKLEKIKNQTEFYESVIDFKIPDDEDAKVFPTFSLAELMIITADLEDIQKRYSAAAKQLQAEWNVISEDVYKCRDRIRYFQGEDFYEPLAAMQIYFEPINLSLQSGQKIPKLTINMTTGALMKIVKSKLLPLVTKFEDIKIQDDESPFFEKSDLKNPSVMQVLHDLMEHTEIYDAEYETMMLQWIKTQKKMEFIFTDDSRDRRARTTKWRLEEMAMEIERDMPDLIDRIKNLSTILGIRSYKGEGLEDEYQNCNDNVARDEL